MKAYESLFKIGIKQFYVAKPFKLGLFIDDNSKF